MHSSGTWKFSGPTAQRQDFTLWKPCGVWLGHSRVTQHCVSAPNKTLESSLQPCPHLLLLKSLPPSLSQLKMTMHFQGWEQFALCAQIYPASQEQSGTYTSCSKEESWTSVCILSFELLI